MSVISEVPRLHTSLLIPFTCKSEVAPSTFETYKYIQNICKIYITGYSRYLELSHCLHAMSFFTQMSPLKNAQYVQTRGISKSQYDKHITFAHVIYRKFEINIISKRNITHCITIWQGIVHVYKLSPDSHGKHRQNIVILSPL